MLYICEQKSIIKMDTDVFLLLSFKLMAQYILHTLPLPKTAKPKKNSNTIIFLEITITLWLRIWKKTVFGSGTPLLFSEPAISS